MVYQREAKSKRAATKGQLPFPKGILADCESSHVHKSLSINGRAGQKQLLRLELFEESIPGQFSHTQIPMFHIGKWKGRKCNASD